MCTIVITMCLIALGLFLNPDYVKLGREGIEYFGKGTLLSQYGTSITSKSGRIANGQDVVARR